MVKIWLIFVLLTVSSAASADSLYNYESIRCVPSLKLFEYSKIAIYNVDPALVESRHTEQGIYLVDSVQKLCVLPNSVSVNVESGLITVRKGEDVLFKGAKLLDIVRVNAEGTIELCLLPNEIYGVPGQKPGRCIFRGFPALLGDGPQTPGEAITIIQNE